MIGAQEGEYTLVSLELRPVPFPVIGWIWVGVALSVVAVGLWVALFYNPSLGFSLVIVGLSSLPFNPRLRRRTSRRLDVDTQGIRFSKGNSVVKVLPWDRVEKVLHGPRRWRRMQRTFPVGTGNERLYIGFIGRTDLESIRVEGFEYELKPDDIERVLAAIAEPTRQHKISVEKREWLVHG